MNIQFVRPDVAEKYVCKADTDITVNAGPYSGPISKITAAGAEHFLKCKHPAIERNETPAAEEAVDGSLITGDPPSKRKNKQDNAA